MAVKLGELLLKAKLITADQLTEALKQQKETGIRLGEALVRAGRVTEEDITETLSAQFGVPSINLAHFEIDPNVLKLVPADVARKYNILPVNKTGATLTIAMADPTNVFAMDDIKFMTGYNVEPVVASEIALQHSIDRHYGASHALELKKVMEEMSSLETQDTNLEVLEDDGVEEAIDLEKLVEEGEEAPVVRLVNIILTDAIKRGASDIHVEPYEKEYRIRYRVDGILYEVMNPPPKLKEAIASRIKILARLDIAEKRLPQDGRINVRIKGEELDIRVSTVPTVYGESVSLRLLTRGKIFLALDKLGFSPMEEAAIKEIIIKPHGIFLVTGPTGSGKSTSLYAFLSSINSVQKRIITIEEPVEYELKGINQIAVRSDIGLTFAMGLRHILRQDPNVVMVGEIRDTETAEIAIRAALTGHLVFSTLHTNDAPSAFTRLIDMGIEPFLVASSVEAVMAQRLVRTICPHCKTEQKVDRDYLLKIGFPRAEIDATKFMVGAGCEECRQFGYQGRKGIYELLLVNEAIRPLILSRAASSTIAQRAIENGMRTLRVDGWNKVKSGQTTIQEVLRVTQTEEHMKALLEDKA